MTVTRTTRAQRVAEAVGKLKHEGVSLRPEHTEALRGGLTGIQVRLLRSRPWSGAVIDAQANTLASLESKGLVNGRGLLTPAGAMLARLLTEHEESSR